MLITVGRHNPPYVDFRNQIGKLYEQWQPYQLSKSTNNLAVGLVILLERLVATFQIVQMTLISNLL